MEIKFATQLFTLADISVFLSPFALWIQFSS